MLLFFFSFQNAPSEVFSPKVIGPFYQQVAGILISLLRHPHPAPYRVTMARSGCGTKVTHSVIFSALLVKVGRWGGRISFNYEISVMLVVISVTW